MSARRRLTDRDLNPGARALIAEAMATMKSGARTDLTSRDARSSSSIDAAAKLMGVSPASVDRARIVARSGDVELIERVKRGRSVPKSARRSSRGARRD
jgi:hypothetical protein